MQQVACPLRERARGERGRDVARELGVPERYLLRDRPRRATASKQALLQIPGQFQQLGQAGRRRSIVEAARDSIYRALDRLR